MPCTWQGQLERTKCMRSSSLQGSKVPPWAKWWCCSVSLWRWDQLGGIGPRQAGTWGLQSSLWLSFSASWFSEMRNPSHMVPPPRTPPCLLFLSCFYQVTDHSEGEGWIQSAAVTSGPRSSSPTLSSSFTTAPFPFPSHSCLWGSEFSTKAPEGGLQSWKDAMSITVTGGWSEQRVGRG